MGERILADPSREGDHASCAPGLEAGPLKTRPPFWRRVSEGPKQPPGEFDLTNLAANADRARRPRVWQATLVLGVGIALIGIGACFLIAPPVGSIPPYSSGPAIFIAVGIVLAGAGFWVRSGLGPSPRRLFLTESSIDLAKIPHRSNLRIRWDRPGFKMEIHDFREIRTADPRSRSKGYEIILHPPRGPETAVPREALEAITQIAESRGMAMTTREVSIGAKAPMIVISIRGSV